MNICNQKTVEAVKKKTKYQLCMGYKLYPIGWFGAASFLIAGIFQLYTLSHWPEMPAQKLKLVLPIIFGLWFVVYFDVPFTIVRSKLPKLYGPISFSLDVFEIALIFVAFHNLGLIVGGEANYSAVYFIMFLIPITAGVGNYLVGRRILCVLSALGIIVTLFMASYGSQYLSVNVFGIMALYILLATYLIEVNT